jgi:hypothetical protein
MPPTRLVLTALLVGAIAGLIVAAFGPLYGGVFLLPLVPLCLRGGVRAVPAELIGFGAVWTTLVARHLLNGGSSGDDALLITVGVIPLITGMLLALGSTMTGGLTGLSRANG